MKTLTYSRQTIEADDIQSVVEALQSDYLTGGSQVSEFEKEIAAYCGSRYAVVCANGTAALHLACLALGIEPGDGLVTSAITFLASANCGRYLGAQVAFSDTDPGSQCLSVQSLEMRLAQLPRPRVVVPVHFAGATADMPSIAALSRRYGAAVIEDGCHALGSSFPNGRKVGSCEFSDLTIFSFHPLKAITTGEGGAITTNREDLYHRLVRLRSHGIERDPSHWVVPEQGFEGAIASPWYHEMQSLGLNYRLTDVQCALGRSQLRKLDRFVEARRQVARWYREELLRRGQKVRAQFPEEVPGHSYHLFPVLVDFENGPSRSHVMRALGQAGIHTQVHYIPVYRQPYYRALFAGSPADFPNAERYYSQTLSLPIFPSLERQDVARVVKALYDVL